MYTIQNNHPHYHIARAWIKESLLQHIPKFSWNFVVFCSHLSKKVQEGRIIFFIELNGTKKRNEWNNNRIQIFFCLPACNF